MDRCMVIESIIPAFPTLIQYSTLIQDDDKTGSYSSRNALNNRDRGYLSKTEQRAKTAVFPHASHTIFAF